jgi:hypothetical protein
MSETDNTKALITIGRAEKIDLVDVSMGDVPAKVDTGADSSSIWVSHVAEQDDGLHIVFFGTGSPYFTGDEIVIRSGYRVTRVANSFGQKELRYKLKLRIRVRGRLIRATFTLSDRSQKTYPILLGRRLLQGKFIVDVSQGEALIADEKQKAKQLKQALRQLKNGETT